MILRSHAPGGMACGIRLIAVAASAALFHCQALALEGDLVPRDAAALLKDPALGEESERRALAAARYLQAIFEEETQGPDRALNTKREVLSLDPAFTDLAMDVAHQYLRRGEVPEATAVLKDAAKNCPSRVEPPVALAGIYLRQLQKPDLAERYASQALASCPDDQAPYQILFEIYKSTGQNPRIDGLFSKALKRTVPSADFWLDLADLKLRDRIQPGSPTIKSLLDRAQDAAADNPESLVRVAGYFALTGEPERAIPLYQLALKLRTPPLDGVRDKLVDLLIQKEKWPEAAAVLDEIIKANPLDFRAYDRLAGVYLNSNELPRALSNMRQALLVAPPDPRRYDQVVRLCLRIGNGEEALKTAQDAEARFPGVLEFSLYKALALSGVGQHEEAIKVFERILVEGGHLGPGFLDADFFFSYGVAAEQAGRFVKAAELLKKSIELDPSNSARSCNYLGYMWADRGENLQEAEQLIRRALAADPENGAYLDSLGWALFRQGRFADALAELLAASERLSQEPDSVVFEHIGDVCEKLGKSAEAVIYWQKALRLDPQNPGLVSKLDAHASRVVKTPSGQEGGR